MQIVAVDILGPLPESEAGNSYILVSGDYFTKWIEAYAISNQETTTIAKKLMDEMFCRFSPPEQLHSDQGRQFESTLMKEICDILKIKKTRASAYHPQCEGLVERFNHTLLSMLSTTTKDHLIKKIKFTKFVWPIIQVSMHRLDIHHFFSCLDVKLDSLLI